MQGDLLTWPEPGTALITLGVVFFVMVLVVFLLTRWLYLRRGQREARWSVVMQYALKHRLGGGDLRLLRRFFDTLGEDESMQVVNSKRLFHAKLHDFLARDDIGAQHRDRVRILDSLFPAADFQVEVKSMRDLQAGEACSLEFEGETHLATIVKQRDEDLWISLPGWEPARDLANAAASVYVFRQNVGGFLLEGRLLRAGKGVAVFGHVSKITAHGNQHLMAEIEVPLRFTPWPPLPPAEDQPDEGPDAELRAVREPVVLTGLSKLVSDRALLFFFEEDMPDPFHLLERSGELWEIDMTLPRGYEFQCRGAIVPGSHGRYLFKYVDATETQRRGIFDEIKHAGAKRERLV